MRRTPVCSTYCSTWVCGLGPPSPGGIAGGQTLGILENFNLAANGPTLVNAEGGKPSVLDVHLVSEAERLAYADRNKYVADTDFVSLPGGGVEAMLKPFSMCARTRTTDNGREFAQHERIVGALDADFVFAHPYSSWERGANENMNGLIRQFFPRKMAFESASQSFG